MSGLVVVNENLKVSVGAARRSLDSAERRAAGKGARQRGEADPCRRARFGDRTARRAAEWKLFRW